MIANEVTPCRYRADCELDRCGAGPNPDCHGYNPEDGSPPRPSGRDMAAHLLMPTPQASSLGSAVPAPPRPLRESNRPMVLMRVRRSRVGGRVAVHVTPLMRAAEATRISGGPHLFNF